ncbi:UNVERIFIED_CONTAM: hypothetical protein PYX00_003501 [Menopon gallinae]|uniref:Uncharacterized protein n=1 Tax=Menopon gallinae TaxID=328185 RepID=A0AAW2I0J9_9NEOP
MRRLTSPKSRDLSARRTLDPNWQKSGFEEGEEDDSDPYPDSDPTVSKSKKSSK